jgi:hypothetical protein
MRILVLAVLASSLSCGMPMTAQTRRSFPVEVVVVAPTAALDTGWTVTDLAGTASLSSLRFFTGKVLIGQRFDPMSWLISTAHAHPGHYIAGEALGEVLAPIEVDLATRVPRAWGTANAVTGSYGSAQLTYAVTGVRVTGTATKAGQTVKFDTGLFKPPAALEGLKFDREMDSAPGTVRMSVDLGVMLSRIEFDKGNAMPGASGVVVFDPVSPASNGFDRGVEDTGSYQLSWQSN